MSVNEQQLLDDVESVYFGLREQIDKRVLREYLFATQEETTT